MKKHLNDLINDGIFDSNDISSLNQYDFANFLDVINKGEKSYFNLCKDISFENSDLIDPSMYTLYTIIDNDCWTNISYKFYGTINLWWLICKFNNIKNPFTELISGNVIKIPNDSLKDIIIDILKAC